MSKYIRTKDGITDLSKVTIGENGWESIEEYIAFKQEDQQEPIKVADTIEELCDELVIDNPESWEKKPFVSRRNFDTFLNKDNAKYQKENNIKTYGAIWTEKGLIFVAKMNDKGELELL